MLRGGHGSLRLYIIHLPDRKDRAHNVMKLTQAAQALGLHVVLVPAVDRRSCAAMAVRSFHDWSHKSFKRDYLRPGEQGCLLSHLSVWKDIHDNPGPALVVEDDCLLSQENLATFRALAGDRNNEREVYHGFVSKPALMPATRLEPISDSWQVFSTPQYTTSCYLLTDAAGRALWPWAEEVMSRAWALPSDDLLSAACNAHPELLALPKGVLRGLRGPTLSHRLRSASDTETPASNHPQACSDFWHQYDLLRSQHTEVSFLSKLFA